MIAYWSRREEPARSQLRRSRALLTSTAPAAIRTLWWKRLASGVLRRLRVRRLRVEFVYRHDLTNIPAVPLDPACRIEVLDPAQVERLLEAYPVNMAEKHRRLAAGHICYIGLADGKVAHFNWVQSDGVHLIPPAGRRRRVRPGEIWIYSSRTAEWARGRRLQPATLVAILEDFRRNGYSRAWICTERENLASQRGIERVGFRLVKKWRILLLSRYCIPLP